MKNLEDLKAAFNAAKAELQAYKKEQVKNSCEQMLAKYGTMSTIDTEDSTGVCDEMYIFGVEDAPEFIFVGRDSAETQLLEMGFRNFAVVDSDGNIEEIQGEDFISKRSSIR
jgi:hypothetical protein